MTRFEYLMAILMISVSIGVIIFSEFSYSSTKLEIYLVQNDINKFARELQELEIDWARITSPHLLQKLIKTRAMHLLSRYNNQSTINLK
ncbi:hypothetical protein [Candidatus Gromoviella agglomerans]|uniref:hypothetical protein n=1 Tax=Candidatus Gromoviella agglomerans TaxID=2806609 RepID=UPI001E36F394|nr:hypothetical protein [Candidatus Gromoviella agglomerans]UFX98210.1 hypothetical protein Gromo_00090 [Candidatus Gromoviella agglomerans]